MKRQEFRTRELVRLYTVEDMVDGYVVSVGSDSITIDNLDDAVDDTFYFDDIDEIQILR